ncbi:MAG: dienelactone hydrolase family protein [Acidimicrobiia bacterium]
MAVLSHEGTFPILYSTWPLPIGTGHRKGYLARPDRAGRYPVVLVLPTLDGLGGFEKDLCRRLARNGFVGLAVDFYRRSGDPLDAYNDLSDGRALTDLDEVHEFIISEDVDWALGAGGLGIVGADVGGRFALMTAARRDWVRSVAVAYSPLTGDEEREFQAASVLGNLPIPVLGLYGARDELIDPASVDEAQSRNESGQWLLYENAGHGFLDVEDPNYEPSAADDAWARILAFFKGTLPEPEVIDLG